jgi:hypothetical protein
MERPGRPGRCSSSHHACDKMAFLAAPAGVFAGAVFLATGSLVIIAYCVPGRASDRGISRSCRGRSADPRGTAPGQIRRWVAVDTPGDLAEMNAVTGLYEPVKNPCPRILRHACAHQNGAGSRNGTGLAQRQCCAAKCKFCYSTPPKEAMSRLEARMQPQQPGAASFMVATLTASRGPHVATPAWLSTPDCSGHASALTFWGAWRGSAVIC